MPDQNSGERQTMQKPQATHSQQPLRLPGKISRLCSKSPGPPAPQPQKTISPNKMSTAKQVTSQRKKQILASFLFSRDSLLPQKNIGRKKYPQNSFACMFFCQKKQNGFLLRPPPNTCIGGVGKAASMGCLGEGGSGTPQEPLLTHWRVEAA